MVRTVKQTIADCRSLGMSCRYKDGEYRVNYPNGAESTAYYTSDTTDAVVTARLMSASPTFRKKNGKFGIFGS